MTRKLLLVPAAAGLVAAGSLATAQATIGGPAPAEAPATTIEVTTALDDWCSFMDVAFGPGAPVVGVRAAADASLAAGAATPELAYAAQLGGIPPEVEADVAVLLAALHQLVEGVPVTDPAAVGAAADSVDAFDASACGG
jgi:hypothetical protein